MSTLVLTDDQQAALRRLTKIYAITWVTLITLAGLLFFYLTLVEKVPFRIVALEAGGAFMIRPTLFLYYQFRASQITGVPPRRSPRPGFLIHLFVIGLFVAIPWFL